MMMSDAKITDAHRPTMTMLLATPSRDIQVDMMSSVRRPNRVWIWIIPSGFLGGGVCWVGSGMFLLAFIFYIF